MRGESGWGLGEGGIRLGVEVRGESGWGLGEQAGG